MPIISYILVQEIDMKQEMPTEQQILEALTSGNLTFPPLSWRVLEVQPVLLQGSRYDALVEAQWGRRTARFAVECKARSTPRVFRNTLGYVKSTPLPEGITPMVLMPYLSDPQLKDLEREGVSGIDLCGNGVVVSPGSYAVFRGGNANRFTSSAPIKNIYRRNSSLVARAFLSQPCFQSVQAVCDHVNRRDLLVVAGRAKPMRSSTVSKCLKVLEEDLGISRGATIEVLQPEAILDRLVANYGPPDVLTRTMLKVPEEGELPLASIARAADQENVPYCVTGASSAGEYTVMQRGSVVQVYVPRIAGLVERMGAERTDRFPNLELIETTDQRVYFDNRDMGPVRWASPVQAYLELMAGDKRDQQAASQMRQSILRATEG